MCNKSNQRISKAAYLLGLCKPSRKSDPASGFTTVAAFNGNGRSGIKITYLEGSPVTPVVKSFYFNGKGHYVEREMLQRWKGRWTLRVGDTTISVNELIYQINRMCDGLEVDAGHNKEYNHFYPMAFVRNKSEVFGVDCGDVCPKEQNVAHWLLCKRLYDRFEIKCEINSYSPAFSLMGKKNLTASDVDKYVRSGSIKIIEGML